MAFNADTALHTLPGPRAQAMPLVDLAATLDLDPTSASRACGILVRRDLAVRDGRGLYRLTEKGAAFRDTGAPLHKCTPIRRKRSTFRDRIWKGLRVSMTAGRAPTIDDLVEIAQSGSEKNATSSAEHYIFALVRAGYLRKHRVRAVSDAPRAKGSFRYLLIRNTGPRAPVWRRDSKTVLDMNNGEEHSAASTRKDAP